MKPKLQPLKVPWRISPGATYLELNYTEYSRLQLAFLTNVLDTEESLDIEKDDLNNIKLDDQTIEVIFSGLMRMRLNIQHSQLRTIDPDIYDWSDIKYKFRPYIPVSGEQPWLDHHQELLEQWSLENVCPSPQAYTILNSAWIKEAQNHAKSLGAKEIELQHYLFVFDEVSVEVIASEMKWQAI